MCYQHPIKTLLLLVVCWKAQIKSRNSNKIKIKNRHFVMKTTKNQYISQKTVRRQFKTIANEISTS